MYNIRGSRYTEAPACTLSHAQSLHRLDTSQLFAWRLSKSSQCPHYRGKTRGGNHITHAQNCTTYTALYKNKHKHSRQLTPSRSLSTGCRILLPPATTTCKARVRPNLLPTAPSMRAAVNNGTVTRSTYPYTQALCNKGGYGIP